jgi:hypothetical protein
MGHIVSIRDDEQYISILRVLNRMPGTWCGFGSSAEPKIVVTEKQYRALVQAGAISANGKEDRSSGKKAPAKKTRS